MASDELDLAPDLASQQWWDDNWVDVSPLSFPLLTEAHITQVVAGGSLWNPTLA